MKEIRIVIPDFDEILPEEFVEHMSKAAKEFLLALRSLIDAGIERVEIVERGESKGSEVRKIEIE